MKDEDWLAEAEEWAKAQEAQEKPTKPKIDTTTRTTTRTKDTPVTTRTRDTLASPSSYSLHITNLDYECSEIDLRQHFCACSIVSLRMVYDKSVDNRRLFRGVAFLDVLDKASFRRALSLHHSKLLGRAINVRPTKTKEELAKIVETTRIKVKQKIEENKQEIGKETVVKKNKKTKHRRN